MAKRTQKQIQSDCHSRRQGTQVIARVLTLAAGGATFKIDSDSAGHSVTHDPWAAIYEWENAAESRGIGRCVACSDNCIHGRAEAERELLGSAQPGDGDDRQQIELMANNSAATKNLGKGWNVAYAP